MSRNKITTLEMEISLSKHFNWLQNLIVPNVSWGMFVHECDLLILTPAGYLTEVEIKVSKADLKKDKEKRHKHNSSKKIKYLYFAIPNYFKDYEEHIPERAGIITVKPGHHSVYNGGCEVIRKAEIQNKYQVTEKDRYKLAWLGALRIWKLKEKLYKKYQPELDIT